MNELDDLIVTAADSVKKTGSALIAGIGKLIAAIAVLLAAIITFTDVTLGEVGTADFCVLLAVFLTASATVYFSMESEGERKGEAAECAKRAKDALAKERERLKGEDIEPLRAFLLRYAEKEAEHRRNERLLSLGESRETFDRYLGGERFPRKARRVFRKVERIKPRRLNPNSLFTKEPNDASELKDPEEQKIFHNTLKLLPSLLGMGVTVSVMITLKSGMTSETLLEGAFRLATLLLVGLRGYLCGYYYVVERRVPFTETKRKLLEAYFAEKQA